jgi:hypothetical protein
VRFWASSSVGTWLFVCLRSSIDPDDRSGTMARSCQHARMEDVSECRTVSGRRDEELTRRYLTGTPLPAWYSTRSSSSQGYDLLTKLFAWDPARRLTARESLAHPWFQEEGGVAAKCVGYCLLLAAEEVLMSIRSVFEGSTIVYPTRRVTHEDNGDSKMGS